MMSKRYSFNWERGHPNFWDNHCDLADCYLTCEDVVDRLNELNDENQELKKRMINIIRESIKNERTDMGRNALKQLADNLGVDYD